MNIGKTVDFGYELGMSQIREEITGLLEFLQDKNIKNFLEIGTKLGGNFYCLCELTKQYDSTYKISIDKPGGAFGGWIASHPYLGNIYHQRNHYFEFNYNSVMISGDSHDNIIFQKTQDLLSINSDKLDILYIDGDHTYDGIRQDYEMYSLLVKKDGYIVFHDINDSQHHRDMNCYVSKFWNELQGNKIEFNQNKHWAGIGLLQL